MYALRFRTVGLALVSALGLSACTTGLGYGGLGVGIGSAGYYDPYYGGGYGYGYPSSGYGYGYGSNYGYGSGYGYGYPSYGWYDNYYYPGTGYYVYSRDGRRHRWTDTQRRYWESRRDRRGDRLDGVRNMEIRNGVYVDRRDVRRDRRDYRREYRADQVDSQNNPPRTRSEVKRILRQAERERRDD